MALRRANYAAGSGTASVAVTQSVFTLAASNPAAVSPGSPATSTVTVSTSTGYSGSVSLTCTLTSSPTGATDLPTCSSGSAVTLGGTTTTGTATATVSSTGPANALARPAAGGMGRGWAAAGGAVLAFVLFLGIPARQRNWRSMLGVLVLIAALGSLTACGGHSRKSSGNTGTTAGTYTFTVTATGSPSVSPMLSTTFTVTIN